MTNLPTIVVPPAQVAFIKRYFLIRDDAVIMRTEDYDFYQVFPNGDYRWIFSD